MDDHAYVALLLVHLHFPGAGSLKTKRKDLASVKAQLHGRMGVAVSEVGHQDLWQRCTLGVAIAAGSEGGVRLVAQSVEKIVYREPRVELIRFDVEVTGTELP